jgi:hypothetical protein
LGQSSERVVLQTRSSTGQGWLEMGDTLLPRSALGAVYVPGKMNDDDMDTLYEVLKACKMRHDSMLIWLNELYSLWFLLLSTSSLFLFLLYRLPSLPF